MSNPPPPHHPDEENHESEESFDFKALAYVLVEKWWLILLCSAAATFLTFGYLKRCPRVYAASAILQVPQDHAKILNVAEVVAEVVERRPRLAVRRVTSAQRSPPQAPVRLSSSQLAPAPG